ncbi:MAG: tetratricopeptide repeat protein [Anaerolineae bacterium]|nr:tetratricopeptide repeat protein [Anaerolineae bacterium]
MYLKVPKRYKKQRRHLFSMRRLLLPLFTVGAVLVGWQVYERREQLGPPVQEAINNVLNQAQDSIATAGAPTPLPTSDPAERVARANQAWDRGAIEEALVEYQAASSAAPNNAMLHQRITLGLVMQGRGDDAVTAAERAVTADPYNPDSWALRALALDRAGRPAEAIPSALQALWLSPNRANALAYMAEAYLDMDRPDLAQETVDRALTADPNSYEANYVNALIQWNVNYALDTAADSFEVASSEAPNLPYIAVDRAWFEWSLGNYEVAEDLLAGVLELNPTNLDALYAMGYLYYQAFGDRDQSLGYLERCLAADNDNISCLWYRGTIQTVMGDQAGALASFRALMQTDTQVPRHFLDAGRAYMNSGDCASAVPILQMGYALQQNSSSYNPDREALFEEYLADCGAPVTLPQAEATEEAS